ncbi:MAG: hypothetical protein LUG27_04385 [Clostridiales bacterium]|nr:hypothetical protein [Clostridiales bacterium]
MYVLYDSVYIADDLLYCASGDPVADLVNYSVNSVGSQSSEIQIASEAAEDPTGTAEDASAGAEVEDLPEQSSDQTSGSDDDSADSEDDGTSDTDNTESVTITDIYDVTVTQSYLLAVIAFGVFLACGILLGKAFWDRLKR